MKQIYEGSAPKIKMYLSVSALDFKQAEKLEKRIAGEVERVHFCF